MRVLDKLNDVQSMSLYKDGNYSVAYEYDANGRISKQIVTGDITATTTYEYDAEDNISKEIYDDNTKVITKAYSYDAVTSNITNVEVTSVKKA